MKHLEKILLAAAMFFLPLGFDAAFYIVYGLTENFFWTNWIFYFISLSLLGSSFFFSKISDKLLAAGFFFLPLGYDVLFKTVWDALGSYWEAVSVFYMISFGFFFAYYKVKRPAET